MVANLVEDIAASYVSQKARLKFVQQSMHMRFGDNFPRIFSLSLSAACDVCCGTRDDAAMNEGPRRGNIVTFGDSSVKEMQNDVAVP